MPVFAATRRFGVERTIGPTREFTPRLVVGDPAFTIMPGIAALLFDALEISTGSSGHFEGRYSAFPGFVVADNGWWVMIYRRASIHGLSTSASSLRLNISFNQGQSWMDRLNEIVIEDEDNDGDHALDTGRRSDPYSPSIAKLADGTLILKYERDYDQPPFPGRLVFVRRSTDHGATWGPPIALPWQGTPDGGAGQWQYTSAGGKVVEDPNTGILYSADYYREPLQSRYTSFLSRSLDAGLTWEFVGIIAQDAVSGSNRQFEEPNVGFTPNGRMFVLIRVDNMFGPGQGGDDPSTSGMIYGRFSDNLGASWGPLFEAFPGIGWPAWIALTSGVLVAISRNRITWEPEMWLSYDNGQTWGSNTIFGNAAIKAAPHGGHGNGGYMYGDLAEIAPNIVGVGFGQDNGPPGNVNSCSIVYQEFGIGVAPPIPTYRSTRSALWDNTNATFVGYDSWAGLNGVSRFTVSMRVRQDANNGGTQHLFARGSSTDRQLRAYLSNGVNLNIAFSTGAGTGEATWTLNTFTSIDHNSHLFIVYDGGGVDNPARLRVWRDGVEVTALGTFTGTVPATVRTPTAPQPWYVGGFNNTPGSTLRTCFLRDFAIWPGIAAAASVDAIMNQHVSFDLRLASIGAPAVWLEFENSFADRMGAFTNPVVTGSISFSNTWPFGPGYLA